MPESNILKVFNPPSSQPVAPCIPCTAIQSIVCIGGGIFFASGLIFKDFKTGKMPKFGTKQHPMWFVKTVKGGGICLVGLGAYRGGEVVTSILNNYI
ncbi:hypothetical protein HYPBUDRAFT_151488 [Hyphopichia burtonii NRRL Y-1933]|uniref:DUF4536 domain-containing protein n=1 Tax=Hyphopichia burtonii NRRL Y-1933 TaxID=984485 RepID=A0A1E4RRN0_9ASCO|nr:hypothetical protein HYPBUDRAFT_151488 [Hyphopichia burtonii NRRL Y-1933]ODV69949.1 hypothetical protein HYPBUDRAFT_151488 [Hyphopichia burtonii NRRL Y-1933]